MPPAMMEHRRTHTRPFKSTRNSRIRYDLPSVMRSRAHDKAVQRDRAAHGMFAIGRFVIDANGECRLEAIARDACWRVDGFTYKVNRFYRWNTRQGAAQWLLRHPDECCQVVNLKRLPGREEKESDEDVDDVDRHCDFDNLERILRSPTGPVAG